MSNLAAADTASVLFPSSIYFQVGDVGRNAVGNPNPVMIRFVKAEVAAGRVLRISVRAAAQSLRPASGQPIAAANISWTASGATGGMGFPGNLRTSTYSTVFQSTPNPSAGGVDLLFTLAGPGGRIRAGAHTLSLEWKVESVLP
ncbi:MAG: hypothetical protein HYS04_19350 [Acidobacteria bacterium]|nr:hypothetical protein [Acidobacteriota bacterium]